MNLRLSEAYHYAHDLTRGCISEAGGMLLGLLRSEDATVAHYRELIQPRDTIGPILVGATCQLSLFDWQNDPGRWYIDTRPHNGKPVRRFSQRVPSDFKGLKEEVLEVPESVAIKLELNERYAGEV